MPNTSQYYKSIEDIAVREIRTYEKTKFLDVLQLILALIFLFSLIPVIPYVLTRVVPKYFQAETLLWGLRIHLEWTLFWQLTLLAVSAIFLSATILFEKRRSKKNKKSRLSPAQARFALAFAAAEQIHKYRTNKLEGHLDEASRYFRHLRRVLQIYRGHAQVDDFLVIKESRPLPVNEFHYLSRLPVRYKWFKYSPETAAIIDAFHALGSKFGPRIEARKDLQRVEDGLHMLADYLYTEIPEISEDSAGADQDWGVKKVQKFAELVNSLPEYVDESPVQKKSLGSQMWAGVCYLGAGFQHPLPLVRYLAWLVLLVALEAFGFWACFKVWTNIKIDSAILVGVVGVPIAGAAAIVAAVKPAGTRDSD